MPVMRLNHAVLYVRDVRASVDFYTSVLGFRLVSDMVGLPGAAFLQASGSTNDHDLGLFEIGSSAAASGAGRTTVGLYHLAWEVDTLEELQATAKRLTEACALVGASDHSTTKALYAVDPDGLEFEVMWRVPAQDWAAETADGQMILPLDIDAAIARWGQNQVTGAAAGSPT